MIDIVGYGREKLRLYEVRSLIYHSEYVKEEFPSLYQLVEQNMDKVRALDMQLIEQLPEHDLRIVDNIFSEIILRCKNEWEGSPVPYEELEGENTIPCTLCNAATKKVYYIKNKLSNKVVNVGSTCIDQFLIDEQLAGKTKSQLRREGEQAKRLTIINDFFPGIKRRLEKWDEELDKQEVLIPNNLAIPYQNIGNDLMDSLQSYINKNCGEEIFAQIEKGLEDQTKFIEEFRRYSTEHINDKFVVTRKVANWLKKHGDLKTLEQLKESGYISYSTASNIYEPEFILQVVREISVYFAEQSINIVGTDADEKGIVLQPLNRNDISFICKYKAFLQMFGWIIFGEKPKAAISPYNVVYISDPYNQRSFDQLVQLMKGVLEKHIIKIDLSYYFEQDHDMYLYDTREKMYLSVNRREFVKKFKTLLLKPQVVEEVTNYVDDLIKQGHRMLTRDDLRELRKQATEFER